MWKPDPFSFIARPAEKEETMRKQAPPRLPDDLRRGLYCMIMGEVSVAISERMSADGIADHVTVGEYFRDRTGLPEMYSAAMRKLIDDAQVRDAITRAIGKRPDDDELRSILAAVLMRQLDAEDLRIIRANKAWGAVTNA